MAAGAADPLSRRSAESAARTDIAPGPVRWSVVEIWGATLYGDPCRACGFEWSLGPADAVCWVARLDDHLSAATSAASGDERRPGGGWSVVEYVGHIGDNLRQWIERVQSARLAGIHEVSSYDPDELTHARGHADLALPAAVWSTVVAATTWVTVLRSALVEEVELLHAARGLQRAEDIARNNCHDVYHHLWDIREIAATRAT